ncbi:MAG: PAS domain S-box protein [Ginsengibacter sp.]
MNETKTSEDAARLLAIVQSSQDAIISKKFDGTITSWNAAAEKIFGYTASEAIGQNIAIIIPEELYPEEREIIAKVKGGEVIAHYETIRKRKNGDKIIIALTISPIKDAGGKITGISKIARDISDETEAKRKESMLAAIIDSSDDAIISKTLNGIITSWNVAAQKMFEYTESEAIGKHISIIIPPGRIAEEAVIIENIRQGNKIDHFETVRVSKNGKEINISLTVSPIKDKNGKIIGASKVARDIAEKAEAEKQRQLFTQKLQALNDYKDEFIAIASHELKTPVTVVKANLQMLEYKMANDANVEFVYKTLAQVNKLSELINSMLDVSKIQFGKLHLYTAVFELDTLLKVIVENMQQTTLGHEIICKVCDETLLANADSKRIEQVMVNLLTNAIKYSPNHGDIIVDAIKTDGNIIVSVKDNGIGIPAGDIDNIFSRFYRVSGAAAGFSGSGIGLYISAEIIKQHGGKIWVESEAGKGSVFYFSIPAID